MFTYYLTQRGDTRSLSLIDDGTS